MTHFSRNYRDILIDRDYLHDNPEVSGEETHTLAYIHNQILKSLKEAGWESEHGHWVHHESTGNTKDLPKTVDYTRTVSIKDIHEGGLIVDLENSRHDTRMIVRADIDALAEIEESPNNSPRSKVSNVMHACGHDCHTAVLLGLFRRIVHEAIIPAHNLRFVWQRAEEKPEISGGRHMVESGVLEGVDYAFAMHMWPDAPVGTFLSRPGAMLGNTGLVKITIESDGGHMAFPHVGDNAQTVARSISNAIADFAHRMRPPNAMITLAESGIHAPSPGNIRPGTCTLFHAVRSDLDVDDHKAFAEEVINEIHAVARRFKKTQIKVQYNPGHPAVINHPGVYELTRTYLNCARLKTDTVPVALAGEDFGHYLNGVPGCLWLAGCAQEGCGKIHTPTFNPNPDALGKMIQAWITLVTEKDLI